jgi:hypothetical protein
MDWRCNQAAYWLPCKCKTMIISNPSPTKKKKKKKKRWVGAYFRLANSTGKGGMQNLVPDSQSASQSCTVYCGSTTYSYCVTLGKLFILSVHQFSYFQYGDDNSPKNTPS